MSVPKFKKTIMASVLGVSVFIFGGTGFRAASPDLYTSAFAPGPEPVALIETAPLDFGVIQPPSSGIQEFAITPSGGLQLGIEGDGRFLHGQSTGSVLASGVQFNVTAEPLKGTCTVPGTDLTDVQTESSVSANSIRIGGHLKVHAGASGDGICEYILTANYN